MNNQSKIDPIKNIETTILESNDRKYAHKTIKPILSELCSDRVFIYESIKKYIKSSGKLFPENSLSMPLLNSGDIMIYINLFVPIRDGGKDICQDNIHHHGWRLLSTGVISGSGYKTIEFIRNSHKNRDGKSVDLKIDKSYRHTSENIAFIDSHKAHVVFHPKSLSSTLAIWSADKEIKTQNLKRFLENFNLLRTLAVKFIHFLGLGKFLGLNILEGLYYHPEGGRIIETQNYKKESDGDNNEIMNCWFCFYQQVGFTDSIFWNDIKKESSRDEILLIDSLLSGKKIQDVGVRGNIRRRFSRTQIMQALDQSYPCDIH